MCLHEQEARRDELGAKNQSTLMQEQEPEYLEAEARERGLEFISHMS